MIKKSCCRPILYANLSVSYSLALFRVGSGSASVRKSELNRHQNDAEQQHCCTLSFFNKLHEYYFPGGRARRGAFTQREYLAHPFLDKFKSPLH
jgi:hypothetical protein